MANLKTTLLALVVAAVFGASAAPAGTIKGKITDSKKKDIPHTVVYIDSVKGEFKPPEDHVLMDQKNLVFVPHVLPVLAGTTVDFLNSDEVAHNVFSPDQSADKFNLGTWPSGEIRSHRFERKTCDEICAPVMLCNVHPEMEAFVLIMQNPYYGIADDSGHFEIPGVPAGTHTVRVWNPKREADPVQVEITDSGVVAIEFTLQKKAKK